MTASSSEGLTPIALLKLMNCENAWRLTSAEQHERMRQVIRAYKRTSDASPAKSVSAIRAP
jgi:hypothetical protein